MSCKCFLARDGHGLAHVAELFHDAGQRFDPALDVVDGVVLVAVLELGIQRFQAGAYLADGPHVDVLDALIVAVFFGKGRVRALCAALHLELLDEHQVVVHFNRVPPVIPFPRARPRA